MSPQESFCSLWTVSSARFAQLRIRINCLLEQEIACAIRKSQILLQKAPTRTIAVHIDGLRRHTFACLRIQLLLVATNISTSKPVLQVRGERGVGIAHPIQPRHFPRRVLQKPSLTACVAAIQPIHTEALGFIQPYTTLHAYCAP